MKCKAYYSMLKAWWIQKAPPLMSLKSLTEVLGPTEPIALIDHEDSCFSFAIVF